MRLRVLAFVALCLTSVLSATPPPAPAFPQDTSDLKPDPALKFGALPNGLRYIVLRNTEPHGRASLRIAFMAGSLHEEDGQEGLAHFLEHLAFNGSTHFPPGELVKYFQRIGMGFGNDTNAYTSYDHTCYMLELPATDGASLDDGFKVLSDYAGGLLLAPKEIESERGVVLAERRDRDDASYRTFLAEFGFLLEGARATKRHPIGLEETLKTAGRERFADFYDTWYRPDRAVVVAVGDFDPADVEKRITTAFEKYAARAPARPVPALGPLTTPKERIKVHHDAEAPATRVTIQVIIPKEPSLDTAETRRAQYVRGIAHELLNRRLLRLAQEEKAPFSESYAGSSESFDLALNSSIELTGPAATWKESLALAEQELRRALSYGFPTEELAVVVASRRNDLEEAVRTAPTRRSPALASNLVRRFAAGDVFTHPEAERDLLLPVLEALKPEDVHKALREAWAAPGGPRIFITGNLPDVDPTAVKGVLAASAAVKVEPPAKVEQQAFAYTDFGPSGKIAADARVEDHAIRQVRFANGVRLNAKTTDFEAGRVRFSARVGYGRLTEPASQPGLALLTDLAFNNGGLGKHSEDDLRRILAGKTVSVGLRTTDDAFVFSGAASPRDLKLALQLLAAYLTDPGLRPEAYRIAAKQLEEIYNQTATEPGGVFQTEFTHALLQDHRFGLPSRADALARTADEVRAWLVPALAHGPLELSIVGDVPEADVLEAVASTLGALPQRAERERRAELRVVKRAEPAAPVLLKRTTGGIPKALVAVAWFTDDRWDIGRTRRTAALSEVFSNRLLFKIREELGDAYSPTTFNQPSETYDGLGWLTAVVECAPEQAETVANTIRTVAEDLAKGTATDDERDRAVKPMVTGIIENLRTNPYWLGSVLNGSQERPERLNWPRTIRNDFDGITTADLNALAGRYLAKPALVWTVRFDAAQPAAPSSAP